MDLTEAMRLAKKGVGQAENSAELSDRPDIPRTSDVPSSTDPPRSDDEIVPRLEPEEFDAWISDVARALCEESGGDWYALTEARRDGYRRLAKIAVRALHRARIDRSVRRLAGLVPPEGEPMDRRELAEREEFSGLADELRQRAA